MYILFQSNSKKRKLEEVKESAKRRQKMVDDDMDIVEGNEQSELTRMTYFTFWEFYPVINFLVSVVVTFLIC